MDVSHTHRENQNNVQRSVPSRFLCKRGLVSLGISGAFLDPVGGYTSGVSTWIPNLGGKIHIFLSGDPNTIQPNDCCKIHPITVFFLLMEQDLIHPFGFLKQAGGSQLLTSGPFSMECNLNEVTTVWHPALSDTIPLHASL